MMNTQTAARPDQPRRRLLRRVLVVAAAAVTLGALLLVRAWYRPLGPALVLSQPSPAATAPQAASEAGSAQGETDPRSTTLLPTMTLAPQCDGPAVMFVLLIGKDTTEDEYETGFADAIRIARVDFANPSLSILNIPRDLSVRISGLEQYEIVEARLKTAYAYGYAYEVPGGGPSLLAQTLMENFGARIDHYAVANYVAFEKSIDTLGGVDLYLAAPTGDFDSGWVHMGGSEALRYARLREEMSNPSDLSRIDRQTQLLHAVRRQLMSPQSIPRLPSLIASVQTMALTDLRPADISMLACLAEQMESDSIRIENLDSQLFTSQTDAFNHEILLPDYAGIQAAVQRFNAGLLVEDTGIAR